MKEIWSDAPIIRQADDAFGRVGYAESAARLIKSSHTWTDSVVFGLTGAWGSGKSSMLSMILEEFERSSEGWVVARFTPWATSDMSGLLGEFYASLGSALPKQRGVSVRRALATVTSIAAPALTAIPIVGGSVSRMAEVANDRLTEDHPWDVAFEEAARELKALGIPVLVIADDVDRLQHGELMTLLKVVRLLGRFPGVQYLLAYDERTLFNTIGLARSAGDAPETAQNFMEKIVQYPLLVPPLLTAQLISRLDNGLVQIFADVARPSPDGARMERLTELCIDLMQTPRAVDRFLAQLRHHLPLIPVHEINDVDVIFLTLLRVSFPMMYAALPRYRRELCLGHTDELRPDPHEMKFEKFDASPLLSHVSKSMRTQALALLQIIFPALTTGSSSADESSRMISELDYFDRYFAMGVPSHDVADEDVMTAITAARDGFGELLGKLLVESEASRMVLALTKARRRVTLDTAYGSEADGHGLRLLGVILAISLKANDDRIMFYTRREHIENFAVDALLKLSSGPAPTDIWHLFPEQLGIVSKVRLMRNFLRRDVEGHVWTDPLQDLFMADCKGYLLRHLGQRDAAPDDDSFGWALSPFLKKPHRVGELAREIAARVMAEEFSFGDLAARLVRVEREAHRDLAEYELTGIDEEAYRALAPGADPKELIVDAEPIDITDLSWSSRRRFAASRLASWSQDSE